MYNNEGVLVVKKLKLNLLNSNSNVMVVLLSYDDN